MTRPAKPLSQSDADTLYRRLEAGWDRIEAADAATNDTAFLEQFWLSLLAEYQQVVDELTKQEQAGTQKGMFE